MGLPSQRLTADGVVQYPPVYNCNISRNIHIFLLCLYTILTFSGYKLVLYVAKVEFHVMYFSLNTALLVLKIWKCAQLDVFCYLLLITVMCYF